MVFGRGALREIDRRCTEEYGLPSLVLMENAAVAVAAAVKRESEAGRPAGPPAQILVCCGCGNNGGDGMAAARHLINAGLRTRVLLAAPAAALRGDAAVQHRVLRAMGANIVDVRDGTIAAVDAAMGVDEHARGLIVVDALLGTGTDRPVRGLLATIIAAVNTLRARGARVVAVDVPSGVDCETGQPCEDADGPGAAVEADATVSLVGLKRGMLAVGAAARFGRIVIGDIGAPADLVRALADTPPAEHRDLSRTATHRQWAPARPGSAS